MDVLGLRSLGIVAVCIQHMPWEETGKKPVDRVPRITTTSQRSRPRVQLRWIDYHPHFENCCPATGD